jgi:hypothetical protein
MALALATLCALSAWGGARAVEVHGERFLLLLRAALALAAASRGVAILAGVLLVALWHHAPLSAAAASCDGGGPPVFGRALGALFAAGAAVQFLLDTVAAQTVYDVGKADEDAAAAGGVCYGAGCFAPTLGLAAALCAAAALGAAPVLTRECARSAATTEGRSQAANSEGRYLLVEERKDALPSAARR